jgi:hypothetical protein
MVAVKLFFLAAVAAIGASATTLTYNLTSAGWTPGDFAIRAILDDSQAGTIQARVTVTPGRYTGDIVAVYIGLVEPPASPLTILRSIQGADITSRAIDTGNVQSGNIGKKYSIALAIGKEGIGNGKGDIQQTLFTFNTPGLKLDDVGDIAVRMTSVGAPGGSRNLSFKMYDDAGTFGSPMNVAGVPEPSTLFMTAGALIGLAWAGRRRLRASASNRA